MKTVVIWHDIEGDITFFVVDHDISHLNRVYIGDAYVDPDREAELDHCVYNHTGEYIHDRLRAFPVEAVREGAKVIVAGQLP